MSKSTDRIERLVVQLESLADPSNPNRAALAHLRRGIGDNPIYAFSRVGWLFAGFDERDEDAAILTAGLFAWAKGKCAHTKQVSLGKAFAQQPGAGENPSVERRFVDLLETDYTELDVKLRHVISLLAQHNIALDWAQLCRDVLRRRWEDPDRPVQKQWARDFWYVAAVEPELPPETETTVA